MRNLAVTLVAVAALAVGVTVAARASDPRKCSYDPNHAAHCASDQAFLAVRRYLGAVYHLPSSLSWGSGQHTCTPTGARLLVWRCSWTDGWTPAGTPPSVGTATITFRAFANGWHTRVALSS